MVVPLHEIFPIPWVHEDPGLPPDPGLRFWYDHEHDQLGKKAHLPSLQLSTIFFVVGRQVGNLGEQVVDLTHGAASKAATRASASVGPGSGHGPAGIIATHQPGLLS